MRDGTDSASEPSRVQILNPVTVNGDDAGFWSMETQKEVAEGGFSRPAGAHDGSDSTGIEKEIHVFQNQIVVAIGVGERDGFEFDFSLCIVRRNDPTCSGRNKECDG